MSYCNIKTYKRKINNINMMMNLNGNTVPDAPVFKRQPFPETIEFLLSIRMSARSFRNDGVWSRSPPRA